MLGCSSELLVVVVLHLLQIILGCCSRWMPMRQTAYHLKGRCLLVVLRPLAASCLKENICPSKGVMCAKSIVEVSMPIHNYLSTRTRTTTTTTPTPKHSHSKTNRGHNIYPITGRKQIRTINSNKAQPKNNAQTNRGKYNIQFARGGPPALKGIHGDTIGRYTLKLSNVAWKLTEE